eukprot:GHVR01113745.1.p1 GENE.GHVR01113745.1~~GHVR01113745.1.p1  ORF type:complete len:178 (-),score=0.87 GHVR01113745.1:3858-4391(-)
MPLKLSSRVPLLPLTVANQRALLTQSTSLTPLISGTVIKLFRRMGYTLHKNNAALDQLAVIRSLHERLLHPCYKKLVATLREQGLQVSVNDIQHVSEACPSCVAYHLRSRKAPAVTQPLVRQYALCLPAHTHTNHTEWIHDLSGPLPYNKPSGERYLSVVMNKRTALHKGRLCHRSH